MHGERIDAVGGVDLEQAPGHPFAPLGVDVGDQLGAGKVGLHHVDRVGDDRRRFVRRERLELVGGPDSHGQFQCVEADGQVDGVDVADTRSGLDVEDVAVIGGQLRHRLAHILGAVGGCALGVEGVCVGVDRQLDGERQSPHEAAAGLDVRDAQDTGRVAHHEVEGPGDLVGVVDDDALDQRGVDGEAGGGECLMHGDDVGGVGLGGDVVGVAPGLLEHAVDGGAEVATNGGATSLGGTFADRVQRPLVVGAGGRDEGDEVGPLGEAERHHALRPADETGAVVKGLGHGRGPCVTGELPGGR